ncbi:hypothetical protein FA048_10830 [Pedobacter polaris]|uniref:Uncharacterized protein n=1 Tax=Pedobacter polaris TaxID=2571273 RepID=A0A4U1CSE5_9SPHI|nr:DUF6520 family protein [Pedobacter polaris]TKC10663.1 hypothetical protein FA048_10830 [Pedobacter polaris]
MKNSKIVFPAIAIVLGLGIAFSSSAFKPSGKVNVLKYRYIGTNEAGLTTLSNWTDVSTEENPTPCEAGDEIPCLVQFQDNEYDNIADFITTNDTKAEMYATSKVESSKNEQ